VRHSLSGPLVLVAHGSSDPRAAAHTRALANAVGARPAYLDHAGARLGEVLFALQRTGERSAVVVPLLLTSAYHGRVDIPAALDRARSSGLRLDVVITDVLGPVNGAVAMELLDGLRSLLPARRFDGIVLAAAGTRDAVARSSVGVVARRLGALLGVPVVAAYASASGPTPGEGVAALRARGARRVAMSAYFLAPGLLYDKAVASAAAAGAVAVAAPLGASPPLAALVRRRIAAATQVTAAA
jgi:sirohydrochlorin ferrochelatase